MDAPAILQPHTAARILIVDDEEMNLNLLRALFRRWGFNNLELRPDPRGVEDIIAAFQPDLVLIDMHMPYRTGVEVLRDLSPRLDKEDFLPIVMLTADVDPVVRREAIGLGACDFVTKPFDRDDLSLCVAKMLRVREIVHAWRKRALHAEKALADAAASEG